MICGDFNARSSGLDDFIRQDDNNNNFNDCPLPADYQSDTPLHRAQLDQVHNLHGELLTNICKDFQLRFLNGRFLGDSLGYFTFFNNNGRSTVDYMLATQLMFYSIQHFIVNPPNEFSDHCLISTYIKTNIKIGVTPDLNLTPHNHYEWRQDAADLYEDALLENESVNDILNLNMLLDGDCNDIDLLVSKANNIFIRPASKTLKVRRSMKPIRKRQKPKPKKPWMNSNGLRLRGEIRSLGKKLHKDPNNIWLRHAFCNNVRT